MWLVAKNGKYQHIFEGLKKPFKMQGQLVRWASICGRSFAVNKPQPNPKRKKCPYCAGKESGRGGD